MNAKGIAVVGMGQMGRNHARVLAELGHLSGVCDTDEDLVHRKAADFGVPGYESLAALLDDRQLLAVIVSTPTNTHERVASSCLDAGLHVLVEKPIAESVVAGERLIQRAHKSGSLLAVGHIERFNPAVEAARRLVATGAIGEPIVANVKRVGGPPSRMPDSSVTLDIMIHDIDILTVLTGKAAAVQFAHGGSSAIGGVLDHAEAALQYGSMTAFLQANWITPTKIRTLSITGTKGHLELNYVAQTIRLSDVASDFAFRDYEEFLARFAYDQSRDVVVAREEPLVGELREFVAACLGSGSFRMIATDALEAVRVAEQIDARISGADLRAWDC